MATVRNKADEKAIDEGLDTGVFAITPSDTVKQPKLVQSIFVGVTGNIAVINRDGITVTYSNVPVGQLYVGGVRYIKSTGTTATNLVANSNKALR